MGYKKYILKEYINNLKIKIKIKIKVSYINNNVYDKINNISSFYISKEEMLKNDILLLEADFIFDNDISLKDLMANSNKDMTIVASYKFWMNETCIKLNSENNIIDFVTLKNLILIIQKIYIK